MDAAAPMATDRSRRIKLALLKSAYILVVVLIGLAVLEVAARLMGLGDPIVYYSDAWGGSRPVPNQRVTRLGGATVTVDGNCFRTPVAEEPGALRILFLGDSVTWGGSTIDDPQLYTEVAADVFRAQKRPVYAMNAGVNGTSLRNHAERFQKQGENLDALVWLFPWGDTLRNYASGGQISPPRYKPKLALVEPIDYFITHYWLRFSRDAPARQEDFIRPERPDEQPEFFDNVMKERVARNLDAVREVLAEAKQRGVPVVIGVTPYRKGDELEELPPDAVAFLDVIAAAGATVFDVSAALSAEPEGIEQCYIDRAHFTARGHQAVGKALGAMLEKLIESPPASDN